MAHRLNGTAHTNNQSRMAMPKNHWERHTKKVVAEFKKQCDNAFKEYWEERKRLYSNAKFIYEYCNKK
jgi:hypothetical protein